ncbi:uncharacterized protein LOC135611256 isoform X2 [Musa acuminata AAA Group]|uniref:uncharacterized protein LOC135611256 isoform X2 n=1 Tax=Musa acuminata AAA Group TaxID=214697 RepID=UPI0031DB79E9
MSVCRVPNDSDLRMMFESLSDTYLTNAWEVSRDRRLSLSSSLRHRRAPVDVLFLLASLRSRFKWDGGGDIVRVGRVDGSRVKPATATASITRRDTNSTRARKRSSRYDTEQANFDHGDHAIRCAIVTFHGRSYRRIHDFHYSVSEGRRLDEAAKRSTVPEHVVGRPLPCHHLQHKYSVAVHVSMRGNFPSDPVLYSIRSNTVVSRCTQRGTSSTHSHPSGQPCRRR